MRRVKNHLMHCCGCHYAGCYVGLLMRITGAADIRTASTVQPAQGRGACRRLFMCLQWKGVFAPCTQEPVLCVDAFCTALYREGPCVPDSFPRTNLRDNGPCLLL